MQMDVNKEEKQLINDYRNGSEQDKEQISFLAAQAARVNRSLGRPPE